VVLPGRGHLQRLANPVPSVVFAVYRLVERARLVDYRGRVLCSDLAICLVAFLSGLAHSASGCVLASAPQWRAPSGLVWRAGSLAPLVAMEVVVLLDLHAVFVLYRVCE
jgi:hypothetical protein